MRRFGGVHLAAEQNQQRVEGLQVDVVRVLPADISTSIICADSNKKIRKVMQSRTHQYFISIFKRVEGVTQMLLIM